MMVLQDAEKYMDILRVELNKTLKSHIQIGGGLVHLLPLPCLRLPLCFEAALLGLFARTCPVGVAVDDPPCVRFFFLIN